MRRSNKVSTRYFTNAFIAVLGGSLVVFSQSLSSDAVRWIGFGAGIAVLLVLILAQLDGKRGIAQRGLDAAMAVTAGTLIVFTAGTFSGTTLVWLVFAFGLGFLGISLTGLTLHEIENWRAAQGLGTLHWLAPAEIRGEEAGRSTDRVAA
jgi:hypothetical protein